MVSQQATRCAISAFASFRMGQSRNQPNNHTMLYLGRCYKYMRQAISSCVSVDLFYACYIVFKLANFMNESIDTLFSHFWGMHEILNSLKATPTSAQEWEWQWLDGLVFDSLGGLWWKLKYNELFQNPHSFAIHIKTVCSMLHSAEVYAPRTRDSQERDYLIWKITRLEISIIWYFSYYLLLVNHIGEEKGTKTTIDRTAAVTTTLIHLLDQFIESLALLDDPISRITESLVDASISTPTHLDISQILRDCLYFSAVVIRHFLTSVEVDRTDSQVENAAIYLYRMSVHLKESMYIPRRCDIRCVFLAGLVLAKSRFPNGNTSIISWAKSRRERLHQSTAGNSSGWFRQAAVELLVARSIASSAISRPNWTVLVMERNIHIEVGKQQFVAGPSSTFYPRLHIFELSGALDIDVGLPLDLFWVHEVQLLLHSTRSRLGMRWNLSFTIYIVRVLFSELVDRQEICKIPSYCTFPNTPPFLCPV